MKEITGYIRQYFSTLNKSVFLAVTLFTGILIFLNFHYGLEDAADSLHFAYSAFAYRYILSLTAFALPFLLYALFMGKVYFSQGRFVWMILIAPAIFSLKMTINTDIDFHLPGSWNEYLNQLSFWPIRFILTSFLLFIIWYCCYRNQSFFGLNTRLSSWKPYLLLLAAMIPLITLASFQPDFLDTYPKMKIIDQTDGGQAPSWLIRSLFEISYGTDFISVELFFRGFLILAFIKITGKDAILPMACFYCTIHFGKPLGECISSYFGGILLGIIVMNTRSVLGGLIVHLGIAWLMELGGYLGNTWR